MVEINAHREEPLNIITGRMSDHKYFKVFIFLISKSQVDMDFTEYFKMVL